MTVCVMGILQPESVPALLGFEVNDLRAEVGEVFADTRSQGVAAEFDHLDLFERIFHWRITESIVGGCRQRRVGGNRKRLVITGMHWKSPVGQHGPARRKPHRAQPGNRHDDPFRSAYLRTRRPVRGFSAGPPFVTIAPSHRVARSK